MGQLPIFINPIEDPDWDRFVGSHRLGAIYHHSSWLKVLRFSYPQLSLAAFVVKGPDGRIRSALPFCIVKNRRKAISMPFTPYCDPLIERREDADLLFGAVAGLVDANIVSSYELRSLHAHDFTRTGLVEADYRHKTNVLSLDGGIQKVRKSFHRTCVSQPIKKAIKLGVVIREASSEADLKVFVLLHARTRKRLGLPIQPISFFSNMWRFMHPERLTLHIAEYREKPIGSLLTLNYKETVWLEYIGYDIREVLVHPNHLLYFRAIEKACNEGFSFVDFGRTSTGNESLLRFKRRWGTEENDISYLYYPAVPKSSSVNDGKLTRKLFSFINRTLPFPIAREAGKVIYRYIGVG
jgi:hypothetical protein